MGKVIDPIFFLPDNDLANRSEFDLDFPKMKEGGLNAAFFAAWTNDSTYEGLTNSNILSLLNALYWTAEQNPDSFGIAKTTQEIIELYNEGKLVGIPAIEGAYSLKNQVDIYNAIELLRQYHDLGVAYITLCWSNSNDLGEGVNEQYIDGTPSSGGLTELGAEVVREMNRLGIAVDVSHMNDVTFWDVVETSTAPIIASHSNAWSVFEHERNLKDEQLIAIAESGGVVHQNLCAGYMGPEGRQGLKELIDMIDYTVKLIGVDHVGLGSDFDGSIMLEDLPNASYYYKIAEELTKRGYSEEDINKIQGQNTLRVIKAIQDMAKAPLNAGEPLEIIADLAMGEGVENYRPLLSAKISGNDIDSSSLRIIVDGDVYVHTLNYDVDSGILSLQVTKPLAETFHVVTFEGANTQGRITRETKIFYVETPPVEPGPITLSDSEWSIINTRLTECFFQQMRQYDGTSDKPLIQYVWHGTRFVEPELFEKEDGYYSLSADHISLIAKFYFGKSSIKHQDADYITYKDGRYYMPAADYDTYVYMGNFARIENATQNIDGTLTLIVSEYQNISNIDPDGDNNDYFDNWNNILTNPKENWNEGFENSYIKLGEYVAVIRRVGDLMGIEIGYQIVSLEAL
jgi:membrane dipeptidase